MKEVVGSATGEKASMAFNECRDVFAIVLYFSIRWLEVTSDGRKCRSEVGKILLGD